MPVGGTFKFKGGGTLRPEKDLEKKERKKAKKLAKLMALAEAGGEPGEGGIASAGCALPPLGGKAKTYEEEFVYETKRMQQALVGNGSGDRGDLKVNPWASAYKKPTDILHGYDKKVKGDTASKRLDIRSAMKADKFCW